MSDPEQGTGPLVGRERTGRQARERRLPALVEALRPRQQVKNLLVAAVPLAAGDITHGSIATDTVVAFVCFCLASGAVYLVNDMVDAPSDRRHPRKALRPIASGRLGVRTALVTAAVLTLVALGLTTLAERPLLTVLVVYLLVQVAYTSYLKREPVLDLLAVASGFLLRAVAGGPGTGTPVSVWFLIVAAFASLFVVAGKRYSEIVRLGSEVGTRKVLRRYTDTYLRFVWTLSAGITVMAYCLWAFRPRDSAGFSWDAVSTIPFVAAMLRYAIDVDSGDAGEPEEIVLRDPVLLALGGLWLAALLVGIFRG